MKKTPINIFERGIGVVGLSILKLQILMEKHALKYGCFKSIFKTFTLNHVGWLIILPHEVGWDIMGMTQSPYLPF